MRNSKAYVVRPYFGHDCNSFDGFNNGNYLDPIEVRADSPEQATVRAMALYRNADADRRCYFRSIDNIYEFGDSSFYFEGPYFDDNSNEISFDQFCDLNENGDDRGGYLYQYIDFGDVELKQKEVSDAIA